MLWQYLGKMNDRYRLNSEWIRAEMAKEGRKLSWLATKIGCHRRLVDRMLGESHVPRWETLKKLAEVMGCEVDHLLVPREAQQAG